MDLNVRFQFLYSFIDFHFLWLRSGAKYYFSTSCRLSLVVFFTIYHKRRLASAGTLNWNKSGPPLWMLSGNVNVRSFGCYRLLNYLLSAHHPHFGFWLWW